MFIHSESERDVAQQQLWLGVIQHLIMDHNPKLSQETACGRTTLSTQTDLHSFMIIAGAIVTTCSNVRIWTSICR
ncbi:MAG: hypothetical protein EZS28_033673 [Streblomastix strix]|uniref:Uncharacterized protein n=1 Tax=Streblomastix strix TaxID=222440 RepID=A0A5J4ULA5_9EUKA|nr:MAG: hypothetical protein EZS28_033673 [Streblomastix strix]